MSDNREIRPGQKIGHLKILGRAKSQGSSRCRWDVQCDCGKKLSREKKQILKAEFPSCGCRRADWQSKPDIAGKKFGLLTVVGKSQIQPRKGRKEFGWELLCDCGEKIVRVRGDFDKRLGIKSCGCSSTALKKRNAGLRTEDLTGRSFGDLVVLKTVRGWNTEKDRIRSSNECKCNCGTIVWRTSSQLKQSKFLNCRGANHLVGPKYPPMPSPMPDRVGELIKQYWHFAESQRYTNSRQDIQDEKISRLERSSWVVCFREWRGEELSDQYIRNFILKWTRFAGKDIIHRSIQLRDGRYNNKRKRKSTGGEMTNPTSFYDAVHGEPKTQQENSLSKPKKYSFRRR